MTVLVGGAALLLVGLEFAFWYLNRARGVGWMLVFFLVLVLVANYAITRTQWGRSLLAVGGNREAARRSGINVSFIYWSAFVLTALLASVGGLLSAGPARLGEPQQRHGRRQPERDRRRRHRRHQPLRRPGQRLLGPAGHARHRRDRQRADAAQPRVVLALRDHRRRAGGRGRHRLAGARAAGPTTAVPEPGPVRTVRPSTRRRRPRTSDRSRMPNRAAVMTGLETIEIRDVGEPTPPPHQARGQRRGRRGLRLRHRLLQGRPDR